MITVTDEAKKLLYDLRESAEVPTRDMGFRLAPGPSGQLELYTDMPQDGDHVVKQDGTTPLLISSDLLFILAGATMDCRATPDGPRLVVNRASAGNS